MRNIICYLFLLLPLSIWAQNSEIKRLGRQQGLSNNYIKDISQDSRGFLWFATEEGLSCLEGSNIKVFLKNELHPEKGLSANELNCVYADQHDPIIWIGTQRAGLCAYNYITNEFTSYYPKRDDPHSLSTTGITAISPAQDGNLWIATYGGGINFLDKSTGQFTRYNAETVQGISNLAWTVKEGVNGELYIGHVDHGFSILSPATRQYRNFTYDENDPNSLPHPEVSSICKDKNGNLWIGTRAGLALYNPEEENFITFRDIPGVPASVSRNYIPYICQVGDDLWLATEDDGIYLLNLQQHSLLSSKSLHLKHLNYGSENTQLSCPNIHCIFQDSYQNVWIGTWGTGVNFISDRAPLFQKWTFTPNQQAHNALNTQTAWGICADSSDQLWIGTEGGGINLFDKGKRIRIFNRESGDLQDNRVLSAFNDSQGTIWFGLYKGTIHYTDKKDKLFHILKLDGDNDLDIRALYEDQQKRLWIGSHKGVFVVNLINKKILGHYDMTNSPLSEEFIRSITEDKEQRMWIGTFGQGINVFSSDMQRLEIVNRSTSFCSNRIEHIFRDSKKRMWVATSEGAALFPETSNLSEYQLFRRADGLASSHVQAIAEDSEGNIWLSTNSGISRISTDLKTISNYSYADGVPIGEFIAGSVTKDSKGNIYFGSNNGTCYFDPLYVAQHYSIPPVIFTELKIEDGLLTDQGKDIPILTGQKIKLNHRQNTFSISFNVQNYSLNGRVEYAYRLKGMNDTWYTLGDEGKVIFRNLPAGDYTLQIKTRLHNQDWASEISTLPFTVTPPFWKSWWAKIIYILLIIIIIIYQSKSYKRKIDLESNYKIEKQNHIKEQEINNERLRFFTNITHELRTPLTLILGPLEDLKKDAALSKVHAQKVSIIHQSAIRLLNLINQILEFRKTETQNKKLQVTKANLSSFIHEIFLKYKELNRNAAITFEIEIKEKNLCLYFDKEIVTMILDNLISNAIKYTPEGSIRLTLERESEEYIAIRISDTGYGISKEAIPHIFQRYYQEGTDYQASGTGIGLSLVKNLVELHRGKIQVESVQGKGSEFIFTLPTHDTYLNVAHIPEEMQPAEVQEAVSTEEASTTDNKLVLLVVEDNMDIREYIASSFSDRYEVVTAENGKTGLEKAFQHTPDIIISDIMMPVMNGIELCKTLKKDIRTSHIPVILLTAKDTLEDKEEGYEVGADSYLTKPFSASLLQTRIQNLLDLRTKLANKLGSVNWADKQEQAIRSLNKIDNEFVGKLTEVIEENITSDKIDTGSLAEQMNMSPSTLYRKIKALTGLSTNEFIRKVKMNNAERLLLEQKYTISEISYRVGINTVAYFRQCFQKEYGMSPSQYLKKVKGIVVEDEE